MATTRATGREPNPVDDEFLHHLYRGGELLAAGKVIEAKDYLERAHKLQPKSEKGQNLLGLTYFKLGLFDRAAELYEMLVRENPVDPTLRVNLGLVYLKTSALQRAVREFEVAVDLAPDHKKAHNYLGLALAQQGEYGRAREHFLQSGSEAMAEKMTRAIAGEGFSRPAPVHPVKERGFMELEGTEVVREQGGVPVAETPPPTGTDRVIHEEAPPKQAGSVPSTPPPAPAPAPQQALPSAEDDWGAQFGFEEPPQQAAAPLPEEAPESPAVMVAASLSAAQADDLPLSVEAAPDVSSSGLEEGPTAPDSSLPVVPVEELSEDAMPVLMAEPEDAEDLAAIAQHEQAPAEAAPEPALAATSTEGAPFAETSEALMSSVPVGELEARAEATAPEQASPPAEAPAPPEESSADPAGQVLPLGASGEDARHGAGGPVLGELALAVALGGEDAAGPFSVGADGFSAWVEGELLTRLEGLVAFSGQLSFQPEMKRFRGRATDKPFGDGAARMVRASGRGMLFIEPAERRTFLAVELGDESAYLRDECVFAFEEPVMFENGRVPSDVAPDLDLVHLRGSGKVLLCLAGPLRSVAVQMDSPVTVPLTHMVGWLGNLTPRVVPLLRGPEGEVLSTAVELSGEGFALICLPVR